MAWGVRLAVAAIAVSIVPAGAAETVEEGAVRTFGPLPQQAGAYVHYDCVGPDSPVTAPPHSTHTHTAAGFVFDGLPTVFSLRTEPDPLAPEGEAGICPTQVEGPVLEHDFTGKYRVLARCGSGTSNQGALLIDWTIEVLAGVYALSDESTEGSCSGPSGGSYSIEITVSIGPASVEDIPVEPAGGIRLTATK